MLKQLSGLDASFIYAETQRTPMHLGAIQIYDPSTAPGKKFDFDRIKSFLEERLHRARTFRQRIVQVPFNLDHPYWVEDPDFDLNYHVRHVTLPAPGTWKQLCELAQRLHARPMDLNKPLWEFTFVDGLDGMKGMPQGSYAVIYKIHHSAVDGVSGIDLGNAIHSPKPEDSPEKPEKPWVPDVIPSGAELLARAPMTQASNVARAGNLVWRSLPSAARVIQGAFGDKINVSELMSMAPRTRFNKSVSQQRSLDARTFSLSEIKDIKTTIPGATVNDIVLAICGGALRRYLSQKNELPEKSLVAMAPVSVRAKDEHGDMGNLVSTMALPLGSHIADPKSRMEFTHEHASNAKAFIKAYGARELSEVTTLAPAMLLAPATQLYLGTQLANQIGSFFNTIVTNIPGLKVPIYSAGAKQLAHFGLGPIFDGVGLMQPVVSYNGMITITPNACAEMMPDPEFYGDCLDDAYQEIRASAAPVKPKPKRRVRANRIEIAVTEMEKQAPPASEPTPPPTPEADPVPKAAAPKDS